MSSLWFESFPLFLLEGPCDYTGPTLMVVVSSLSRVRFFAIPWTVAPQAPLSMGILLESILEWVAMPSSRGSSQSRDKTQISLIAGGFFTN